jgi:type II secretory pathway component PulJ
LKRRKPRSRRPDPLKFEPSETAILARTGGNPMERAALRRFNKERNAGALQETKLCAHCGSEMRGSPRYLAQLVHCSNECRLAAGRWTTPAGHAGTTPLPDAFIPLPRKRKKRTELQTVAKMLKTLASGEMSPARAAQMRGKIASIIERNLDVAEKVLAGGTDGVTWTPTQARVFATLIAKVVPDISISAVTHEHNHRQVRELSIAELEAIVAAQLTGANNDDLIEVRAGPPIDLLPGASGGSFGEAKPLEPEPDPAGAGEADPRGDDPSDD